MTKSLESQIRSVMSGKAQMEPVRESLASVIRNMNKKPVLVVEETPEGVIDTTKVTVPKELVYESSLEEIEEVAPVKEATHSPVSMPLPKTVPQPIAGPQKYKSVQEYIVAMRNRRAQIQRKIIDDSSIGS